MMFDRTTGLPAISFTSFDIESPRGTRAAMNFIADYEDIPILAYKGYTRVVTINNMIKLLW